MIDLLRRAWDALDSFKQAYPENWHEDDEQVMNDLMKADMKLSVVQRAWVGLTDEDWDYLNKYCGSTRSAIQTAETLLKEKNT